MERLKKLAKALYKAYVGVGIAAMGIIAFLVIFTVLARYFFSLSWKNLDEFITLLFAFTTFWGLGIAVLEDEHVLIDIVYGRLKPRAKKWMGLISLAFTLAVNLVVCVYGFQYVAKVGGQLSPGMGIPMKYMYGIMPVCFILCAVCILIKIILLVRQEPSLTRSPAASGKKEAAPL